MQGNWVINKIPIVSSPGVIYGADAKIREESGDDDFRSRHTIPIWGQGENFWRNLKEKIIKSDGVDDI